VTRDQLLRALAALPATATLALPVAELREALGDEGPVELDVDAVARAFGRSASTVRGWCEHGLLPGAYRLRGRAWRIPPAALAAFREAETRGVALAAPRRSAPSNLAAWRDTDPT
jgi:hypothetical protein